MRILVTGAAGFIGFHLCQRLLNKGFEVIGLDNINDYYDVTLKYARLKELGISESQAAVFGQLTTSDTHENFTFIRLHLEDREQLPELFKNNAIDVVCNLAAQAGVRYSLENPETYIDSNIVGFLNILECSRHYGVKHVVYASSSSVYGENDKIPFGVDDNVDHPISLYAASKKSNELMAYTYSHLFNIPTTGLRFFTVYGPWGRPDMALFLFTKAIDNDQPIQVFNYGDMSRDFTYIDDIINGIEIVLNNPPGNNEDQNSAPYSLSNIGNGSPESLTDFISAIEKSLGKEAKKDLLPMQPGDVPRTWADVSQLEKMGYKSSVKIEEGIPRFVAWYKSFYK